MSEWNAWKLPEDHKERMARARKSLEGLSVGDAFGEQFFIPGAEERIEHRATLRAPWMVTDDTEMGLAVVEVLEEVGGIDQDLLAMKFGERYERNPNRGYGGTAHRILRAISMGVNFRKIAAEVFDGQGSMGNGSAMRVGPLGACFAEDGAETIAELARLSAEVTHTHEEGVCGAIAVALAAAWAVQRGEVREDRWHSEMLDYVIAHTPGSYSRAGIEKARSFASHCSVMTAAAMLGNGSKVTAPDTVPFALWCASHCLHNYGESLWTTVSTLGDRDTTCAIVGSITVLTAPANTFPHEWIAAREKLS